MPDLRTPLLGVAAWLGALGAVLLPGWACAAALTALGSGVLVLRVRRYPTVTAAAALVVCAGVAGVANIGSMARDHGPVADLAAERAAVSVRLRVVGDPRPAPGRFGETVVVRARVEEVTGRGVTVSVRSPVVVLGDASWRQVELGEQVMASGRLAPADGDAAALLNPRGAPVALEQPGVWWRAAGEVRHAIRAAVHDRSPAAQHLVPALVVGDDAGIDPGLADDFRTTGLTHLLAVSGTNLTLIAGFLVLTARWCGVRGRWLRLVAVLGIVGFVLLARTEPSVLRAAVMGAVALIGLGGNGRQRAARCLGVAVVVLLLVDPRLAVSAGFALSVLATAGIVWLAPGWRDAMARWLPAWLAAAVSVPLAAQVACTPVVTALSGQVSLVAVAANLLAAPAVAPATVLGLAGGVVGVIWPAAAAVLAAPAAWSVDWIAMVATRGAALPQAAVPWGSGPLALVLVTGLCLLGVLVAPRLLRSPVTGLGCTALLVVVVAVRPPTPGWPPDGWVLAMCDVGQGDALALRAGPGEAVVVDAGPDPALVDDCLRRLHVTRVPLVVLTHFHADHVDGLSGVLRGRAVGEVDVTGVADPAAGAAQVARVLGESAREPVLAPYDVTRRVGELTLQVLWPDPAGVPAVVPGDGSIANDASVVLLAEVRGVRMLLTGDVEPPAQMALSRRLAGLHVDVLKVPHHGSRYQDLGLLTGLQPRVALVSVGRDNDYGHPSATTLDTLAAVGAAVHRTDLDGDVVVLVHGDDLAVRDRG